MRINAATACFPGLPVLDAVNAIYAGASEPMLGQLATDHIQVCPQSSGHLDEQSCESLQRDYPSTRFRLHANARVLERHVRYDASTFHEDARTYFHAAADRSRRMGARVYSLHAGFRRNCSLAQMFDNVKRIQEIFGDIVVAVEGLYPASHMPQLMHDWREYEQALEAGLPLAIDLSHLQIVEHAEPSGDRTRLVELLASTQCIEVHLSDNDGQRDQHNVLSSTPFWWPYLDKINRSAVVFSEGNQLRRTRRQRRGPC